MLEQGIGTALPQALRRSIVVLPVRAAFPSPEHRALVTREMLRGFYAKDGNMMTQSVDFQEQVSRQWGWIALRGVIALLFGIGAFLWPFSSAWALAVVWGAFALVDGGLALFTGWNMHRQGARWWPYLVFGVVGIVAGLISLAWPGITVIVLVYTVAFWAIFGGISQILAAIRLRKEIEGEWALVLGGVVAVLFGVLLLARPLPEAIVTVTWVIGFFALMMGIFTLSLAFRLKSLGTAKP